MTSKRIGRTRLYVFSAPILSAAAIFLIHTARHALAQAPAPTATFGGSGGRWKNCPCAELR
jgi:hypothetical protein